MRAHLGAVYEESDGAIVYRGEKVGLHIRVFINREEYLLMRLKMWDYCSRSGQIGILTNRW